jgi:tetratricopeptide (TPR) repeat protein
MIMKIQRAKKTKMRVRETRRTLQNLIAIGLIAGVALLAYSNTFYAPFEFDDWGNIVYNTNVHLRTFNWEGLDNLIKNTYKDTIRVFSYFTLALNYYFGEFNILGYHLVNLAIHVAAGIFLFTFLILTFDLPSLKEKYGLVSFKVSLLTSLIFVAHPIQTQSVTYIIQRMASMAGMFYVKGRLSEDRSKFFYFGGSILTWLLGLFSKENVAILPLFILLYEFYFFQNLTISPKGKKILLLLFGLFSFFLLIGLILWGKRYFNEIVEGYKIRDFTLSQRVLTQFRVVLYYLTLLIYPRPSRFNLDYDFPTSKTVFDPPATLISILIVTGLIGYSIWQAKKRPLISFSILWYFGNLIIESSIFPLEMVYEHRLYIPAVGPFILFSLFTFWVIEKLVTWEKLKGVRFDKKKWFSSIIILIIIFFLSISTFDRNSKWRDDIKLWEDTVKKSPMKFRTHHNLGYAYMRRGHYAEALRSFEEALKLNPLHANSIYFVGLIAYFQKDLEKAIEQFQKALQIDRTLTFASYYLGLAYFDKGEYHKAVKSYELCIELNPDLTEVYNELGIAYVKLKDYDQAIEAFKKELNRNPKNLAARINLAGTYIRLGDKAGALIHYREALKSPHLQDREKVEKLVNFLEAGGTLPRMEEMLKD